MHLSEELTEKWKPVMEHGDMPAIADPYKKAVTAILLENQERAIREENSLTEAAPTNNYGDGNIKAYDPILISLVRRAMPNIMAYDLCGVQPLSGPTGLIFAMKSHYDNMTGPEALHGEANTAHTGAGTHDSTDPFAAGFDTGTGMTTGAAEALGSPGEGSFQEMGFSIDKVTVTAKSRALKAEYTTELAQDLKAVHGLDAESELSNILSTEILAEMNREVIRTIYSTANLGAQSGTTTAGVFDLDTDSNGRWSVEKFKGLLFHIEREANAIARLTRRGKGNVLMCSSDVASALSMAGVLDTSSALAGKSTGDLNVDDTANTFAGVINGRMKVFIDPYFDAAGSYELFCVGYRGTSPYDAGMFYCPYVPLQMVRAVGEQTFQPKIGFKTRYGMVANPFATGAQDGAISPRSNNYYRIVRVDNLM